MSGLLCYCRQGFEPELAAELTERAGQAGIAGYARTRATMAMCSTPASPTRSIR
jgi:Predicted SAM-dependent methyltransferase